MTLTIAFSTLRVVPLKGEQMKNLTTRSFAAFALVAAMGIGIPSVAFADSTTTTTTTVPSASFLTAQHALEVQLANRATQLQHLAGRRDRQRRRSRQRLVVPPGTPLDGGIEHQRLDREGSDRHHQGRAQHGPRRDVQGQPRVRGDVPASVRDDRRFVVASRVTAMQGNESTLQSETASIVGLPGYKNALNHYNNYVARLSNWSTKS